MMTVFDWNTCIFTKCNNFTGRCAELGQFLTGIYIFSQNLIHFLQKSKVIYCLKYVLWVHLHKIECLKYIDVFLLEGVPNPS